MSSFRGKAKRLWVLASLGLLVACSGGSAPTSAPVSVPGPPSISPPPAVLASPGPGRFVYVASADGVISIYAIGASSGRLLRVGTETPGGALSQIVAHPSGSLIYAVGGIGANVPPSGTPIWQYKVGSTGALSRLAGPVNVPGAIVNSHDPLVIHPSGLFAYALMDGGGVQQFSIGVDGALSVAAMIDTPSLSKLTVDPSGRFAYAETLLPTGPLPVNGPQFRDFWQASIDGNGLLVNGLVVRPSRAPAASEGHFQLLVDPSTSVLLARGNNIDRVAIGADGALASVLLVTPLPQDTDGFAGLFAGRPVGKSLYSTSGGFASRGHNFVAQFALSAGGNLAPLSPPTVATGGNQPTSIAVESSGKYAYVLDSIRDSLVTTG